MAGHGLHEELMSLRGVIGAEVDPNGEAGPAGVRVRLAPGADARGVGVEIQRVLASYGLRSRVAEDEIFVASDAAAAPPPEDADDVARPAAGEHAETATPSPETRRAATGVPGLASLVVEETMDAVTVTATTTDGRRFSERGEASDAGLARAVVAVVGVLVDGRPSRLLSMSTSEAEGSAILTVLIERAGGARAAGAAVVRAGVPYAVARATWSCLR
jgi:hypothetical protein